MTIAMDQRLNAARRSVHLATQQAYAALVSSNETITGNLPSSFADPTAVAVDVDDDGESNDGADDNDTRAGMDLGLSLFGTSQSYRDQLEEEYDRKLREVEEELEDVRSGLDALLEGEEDHGEGSGAAGTTYPNRRIDSHPDHGETAEDALDDNNDDDYYGGASDGFGTTDDVDALRARVAFLQRCARARKILEDVDAISSATNFATSSGDDARSPSNASAALAFSPSSICSPSAFAKFTFEAAAETAGGTGSPLVRAASLVQEAEEITNGIVTDTKEREGDDGDNVSAGDAARMQMEMLTELQRQIRRRKSELLYRANALVDRCITLEEGSLLVCGVGGGGAPATLEMGESPISTSTPRDAAPPQGPLSDAYRVLELFSDDRFPAFGETLDGAMRQLSRRAMDAIAPCLDELEGARGSKGRNGGRRGGNDGVGYYGFARETLRSVARSRSGGYDRKHDPVGNVRGPAERLRWTLRRAVFDRGDDAGDGAGEEEEERGTQPSPVIIATCGEIADERALSSAPSSDVAAFLASLHFLSNFLDFVHDRVLLRRADLAARLGAHLFGTYPLSPGETSIDSGSAVLGGGLVLVGAAAQGLEEGERRPLMTALSKSMRRLCLPKGSDAGGEAAWGMLRRTEARLIEEVGAFEEKMAGMGLMNGPTERGDGGRVGNMPESLATASSPTGLSVLLSNEGGGLVDSPIHPNGTNLARLDTTFSPTLGTQKTQSDQTVEGKILSPLSQLARSLRQAYVEDRRSLTLNQGRSILLNTDYHNTVQVGTFVPDEDDVGSGASPLSSLDADHMTRLFAFHQCSVSTTARETVDLCRAALDDAVAASASSSRDRLDSLPPMLYRASRELMDLFRAVVPTLHASEVGSIPRTAAVLHNDCVYLAHESLLLGTEYKSKFRSGNHNVENSSEGQENKAALLAEVCTFVDMVPPFRDLATKSMGSMIELQKGQLHELVSPRLANFQQALASNESVSEWDDAETALRAALYHLRHLAQAWTPVLSRNVYHMSMGNLLDMVLTMFLDPVWKAGDITDAASRFVHTLFLDMARGGAEMFLVGDGTGPDGRRDASFSEDTMQRRFRLAKKYAALFEKSQAVGAFMTMRLVEIQRGLEEGVFRSVTARELSHLIGAAYDEGEKRTELLNLLASK